MIDLGAFFATFQPKDWVTAGLAVAAIVVSVLTTVFSLQHNARYFPKPLIVGAVYVRLPFGTVKDTMAVRTISNRGNGEAHDVRVHIFHADKPRSRLELDHRDILKPGESMNEGTWGVTAQTPIERIAVTWRQPPKMSKIRKKVYRVKLPKVITVDAPSVERP